MTEPAGSDRLQQDVPTASATGDDSSAGSSFDDVPLTRTEAVNRDASVDDELPAEVDDDVALIERAGPADGA